MKRVILLILLVVMLSSCQQSNWVRTNEYEDYTNIVVLAHDKSVYATQTEDIKAMWVSSNGQLKIQYENGQTMIFSGSYIMTFYNNEG